MAKKNRNGRKTREKQNSVSMFHKAREKGKERQKTKERKKMKDRDSEQRVQEKREEKQHVKESGENGIWRRALTSILGASFAVIQKKLFLPNLESFWL